MRVQFLTFFSKLGIKGKQHSGYPAPCVKTINMSNVGLYVTKESIVYNSLIHLHKYLQLLSPLLHMHTSQNMCLVLNYNRKHELKLPYLFFGKKISFHFNLLLQIGVYIYTRHSFHSLLYKIILKCLSWKTQVF